MNVGMCFQLEKSEETRVSSRVDLFRANHVKHNFVLNSISRYGIVLLTSGKNLRFMLDQ